MYRCKAKVKVCDQFCAHAHYDANNCDACRSKFFLTIYQQESFAYSLYGSNLNLTKMVFHLQIFDSYGRLLRL